MTKALLVNARATSASTSDAQGFGLVNLERDAGSAGRPFFDQTHAPRRPPVKSRATLTIPDAGAAATVKLAWVDPARARQSATPWSTTSTSRSRRASGLYRGNGAPTTPDATTSRRSSSGRAAGPDHRARARGEHRRRRRARHRRRDRPGLRAGHRQRLGSAAAGSATFAAPSRRRRRPGAAGPPPPAPPARRAAWRLRSAVGVHARARGDDPLCA